MQKAKQTWPGSPGPEKARSPLPRFLRSPARVVGPRGCPISASLSVLIDASEEMSVVNILFHFSGMLPSSSAIRNQVNPFPLPTGGNVAGPGGAHLAAPYGCLSKDCAQGGLVGLPDSQDPTCCRHLESFE